MMMSTLMFRSRSVLAPLFAFGLLLDFSAAIALAQSGPPEQGSTPAETLHTRTELVIVDVVVQDRDGHAVPGLTRDNFALTEQKKPQTIRNFEEHSAAAQKPRPALSPMPPGMFTDYTPVAPDGTLNVLLIDTLNTPMADQNYLRKQLLGFVNNEQPGRQIAVFVLTSRVFMLQGFTSDPAILRTALENKLIAHGSPLLNDQVGGGTGPESLAQSAAESPGETDAAMIALLAQVDNDMKMLQAKSRAETTLDAFNSIGHYLSNFPGRKNVLWFSGSFPLSIAPDPTVNNDFSAMENSNEELRETTNLLTRAQVAVYPIDARGLMIAPALQVSDSSGAISSRTALAQSLYLFNESQIAEHATMEKMASDTGGRAFFNTNGLSAATAEALDAGSNYYTLAYTPADHNWNGHYREIKVKLTGSPANEILRLSYRHGYYAGDPSHPATHAELATQSVPSGTLADHPKEAYTHAAISHGAPAPEDILFKVQAVPLTGKDEDTVEVGNRADPAKMKAPYRAYAVDYLALPTEFEMTLGSDGRHKGAIEFTTYVFDAAGNVLNVADKMVPLDLSSETYKRFMSTPVRLHLLVSAPAKQESYMRILIRDVPNNRYGVVEIPTAEVRHLPTFESRMNQADAAKPTNGAAPAQSATKQ
jgi:VWFA-related protein